MFYNKITKNENNKYGQMKLKIKKTQEEKIMLKTQKGITLIALVVTIVVLLILAGVTISLLLDENGIIAKSKDARIETRASQVEDEVGMWKQHNFINKESNQAQESADTMLASLISRKLLTEDEIDREQELITIKKKDGTVIKEISYSSVTINISKAPATEKSGAVALTVDSVDGFTKIDVSQGNEELNNFVNSLSEEQKKEIIRNGYIKFVNKQDPSANCTTFQGALDWAKKQGNISEATEDAFWTVLLSEQGLDENLIEVLKSVYFNKSTNMIEVYTVTNPDNKISNIYVAAENGTYTFKIKDIVTGKTYTKKVEVNNVDESIKDKYQVVNSSSKHVITLQNKETSELANFSKAYIIVEGELKDISNIIKINESKNYNYIYSNNLLNRFNGGVNGVENGKEYEFIFINDEGAWKGKAVVQREVM